jgi:hypothetical protein
MPTPTAVQLLDVSLVQLAAESWDWDDLLLGGQGTDVIRGEAWNSYIYGSATGELDVAICVELLGTRGNALISTRRDPGKRLWIHDATRVQAAPRIET